jgi:hypothetical protein
MGELKREADQEIREKAYIIVEELIQLLQDNEIQNLAASQKIINLRTRASVCRYLENCLIYWGIWTNVRLSHTNDRTLILSLHRKLWPKTKDLLPIRMHLRRLATRSSK